MAKTNTKAPPSGIVRKSNLGVTAIALGATLVVGALSFIVPPVAAGINHVIDRIATGVKKRREMKVRTDIYRDQIAQTLGIDPARVKPKDLELAAQINPTLAAAVRDVNNEASKDNRNSALVHGAAAVIPGAEVAGGVFTAAGLLNGAKTMGKQLALSSGTGLLMDWVGKSHINSQQLMEDMMGQINIAREQGVDVRTVITPQMIFLLRVSQDEVLQAEIKKKYNKPFQKMDPQEMQAVMLEYKPLADAVTSEAYAVGAGMMPVEELMARAPNLNSNAAKYAVGSRNASFVDTLNAQRALAQQAASPVRAN